MNGIGYEVRHCVAFSTLLGRNIRCNTIYKWDNLIAAHGSLSIRIMFNLSYDKMNITKLIIKKCIKKFALRFLSAIIESKTSEYC